MSCVHSGPRQSQYVNHLPSNDFFHTPPSHHYQPYICQKEKARHFSGWVLFTKYFPPQFTSYRLTIDPNILLQLMEWLGWISENSWPQLASHAVSCLPVSHLPPNQPMFACLCSHWSLLGEELFAFGGAASHVCCHFAKLEQSDRAQHSPPPVDSCC